MPPLAHAPTRKEQRHPERIARISEAPRTRSERSQAAQEQPPVTESILLAVSEPSSYRRAIMGPDKSEWVKAIEAEYAFLKANSVWKLIPYLSHMKVIGSMWKFKLKIDADGNINKFKARLLAGRDQQEPDQQEPLNPSPTRTPSLHLL